MPVTHSEAKGLARGTKRSFASLRMTARTPLKSAHGKHYLPMSRESGDDLTMRDEIVAQLQEQANPRAAEGMARFGIRGGHVLGVSIPILRKMAKATGKNH